MIDTNKLIKNSKDNSFRDEYGAIYSENKLELIRGAIHYKEYEVLFGTEKIGDRAFELSEYEDRCSTKLTDIKIPNTVKSIGAYAFGGNFLIDNITLPYSLECIGKMAFDFCTSLHLIYIPEYVKSIGKNCFKNCGELVNIEVSEKNIYFKSIEGVLFDRDARTLICFPAGKKCDSYEIPHTVNIIESFAFSYCTLLKRVIIPNSVTIIKEEAFSYCTYLRYINLPLSLRTIGKNAFNSCRSIFNITLPENIRIIEDGAFYFCENLNYINLPKHIRLGKGVFSRTAIEAFNVDKDCQFYKSIEGVLFDILGQEIIAYRNKDSFYSIPEGVYSIGESAFESCTNLNQVILPGTLRSIFKYAFWNCRFKSITIPNSVDQIFEGAFLGCSIEEIRLPSSINFIGEFVFEGCNALKKIYISSSNEYLKNRLVELGYSNIIIMEN